MNRLEARMVFDAMQQVARPIIREHFNADSCIASTRIGINVLRYFGIGAKPLPLSVLVFNAEAANLIHEQGLEEFVRVIKLQDPTTPSGPWSIGVGARRNPIDIALDAWQGHLIIEVPAYTAYMDLSIDQVNRPLKNIDVTPHWFNLEPDDPWVTGEVPVMEMNADDGTMLVLDRRVPDPDGFRKSTNWTGNNGVSAVLQDCTERIIGEVDQYFLEAGRVLRQMNL